LVRGRGYSPRAGRFAGVWLPKHGFGHASPWGGNLFGGAMTRRDPGHVGVPEGRLTLQGPRRSLGTLICGRKLAGGRCRDEGRRFEASRTCQRSRRPFTRAGGGCLGPRDSRGSDAVAGTGAPVTCPRREWRRGVRGTSGRRPRRRTMLPLPPPDRRSELGGVNRGLPHRVGSHPVDSISMGPWSVAKAMRSVPRLEVPIL